MKPFTKLIILLLVLTHSTDPTTGQILRIGHCPSFSTLKDFEMDKVHKF